LLPIQYLTIEDVHTLKRRNMMNVFLTNNYLVMYRTHSSPHCRNQFKLDKWTDQGPTITAAFGSKTPEEVSELHAILTEMLQQNPTNAAFSAAMLDARDGDSSGHYPSEYSVGSNPTFARSPSGGE
jgi:hypothetical protein